MKGVLLFLMLTIFSVSTISAAETRNIEVSFSIDEDSANYKEFGFSSTEVSAYSQDPMLFSENSFELTDDTNDLSIIATGDFYAYWKVNHAAPFRIELSGTPLSNGVHDLHWHASWVDEGYPEKGTSIKTLDSSDDEASELIYTHKPGSIDGSGAVTGSLSIDSVHVSMETEDGSGLMPGDYSATLTLTVYGG